MKAKKGNQTLDNTQENRYTHSINLYEYRNGRLHSYSKQTNTHIFSTLKRESHKSVKSDFFFFSINPKTTP